MPQKVGRRLFLIATAAGLSPELGVSQGTVDGARVLASFSFGRGIYYFNPAGLHVEVGQSVQWAGLGTSRFGGGLSSFHRKS